MMKVYQHLKETTRRDKRHQVLMSFMHFFATVLFYFIILKNWWYLTFKICMNVLGVACCAMPLIVVFNNNNMQNNGYCVWGEVKKWISALSCLCSNILKHFCKYLLQSTLKKYRDCRRTNICLKLKLEY